MPTDEELLQQNPDARGLIEAGVPREEVLAGLRQAAEEAAANPTPPPLSRKVSEGPLPPGWEERFDPSTGRRYYVDYATKTTSWVRPQPTGPMSPRDHLKSAGFREYPAATTQPTAAGLPESSSFPQGGEMDPEMAAAMKIAEAADAAEAAEAKAKEKEKASAAAFEARMAAREAAEAKTTALGKKNKGALHKLKKEVGKALAAPPPGALGPVAYQRSTSNIPSRARQNSTSGKLEEIDGILAALRSESTPFDLREKGAAELRKMCSRATSAEIPLVLLDELGEASKPALQRTLCEAIACAVESHHKALLESGAALFITPLLSSPDPRVQRGALVLLQILCRSNEACTNQLVDVGAAPALLGLLSSASELTESRTVALQLVATIMEQPDGARAMLASGVAEPLCTTLIHASGLAPCRCWRDCLPQTPHAVDTPKDGHVPVQAPEDRASLSADSAAPLRRLAKGWGGGSASEAEMGVEQARARRWGERVRERGPLPLVRAVPLGGSRCRLPLRRQLGRPGGRPASGAKHLGDALHRRAHGVGERECACGRHDVALVARPRERGRGRRLGWHWDDD